jgi:NADH oxidase (H2O-forming)
MSAIKIADNVWWVGVQDPDLDVFDIIMKTKHGTTYNAYLVKGNDKIALIDTVKKGFTEEYLNNVSEIVPLDQIDYLVVNHNEPDHSGAMAALIQRAPNLKLVCSYPALPFVQNVLNIEVPVETVKQDHTLDLGGKTLTFKSTPYMHWPDTMMTWLEQDKVLFSCDGFAAHIAFGDKLYADQSELDFDHEFRYYFDAIMRPFTHLIRKSLEKLQGLAVELIATSHGPLIRKDPQAYIDRYTEWCADHTEGRTRATIFYVSSYGNTKKMTDAIAEELRKAGFETLLFDSSAMDIQAARDAIESSLVVLFGTPTFAADAVRPTWDAVNLLSTVSIKGKKGAVYGSYGWGGEGLRLVADRLSGMRITLYEEPFRAKLVPSDEEMSAAREWARGLAEFTKG